MHTFQIEKRKTLFVLVSQQAPFKTLKTFGIILIIINFLELVLISQEKHDM